MHADQLEHVRKGCLVRPREDICMDGSRIEGSHKAWNSLQWAHPSGIEVYAALGHDFFLRRNIRIASARIKNNHVVSFNEFVASTHSSHHVQLVNHVATLFNSLYNKELIALKEKLVAYPTLPRVEVMEMIGLVESAHSLTFGGLVEVKDEEVDLDAILIEDIDAEISEMDQSRFIQSLEVDERLISVRMAQVSGSDNQIAPSISSAPADMTISSLSAPKRKGCADTLTEDLCSSDEMPNSKRRHHAGPLSPSTATLGLPSPTVPQAQFESFELDNESPETQVSI